MIHWWVAAIFMLLTWYIGFISGLEFEQKIRDNSELKE
jgi:hypothetical protein